MDNVEHVAVPPSPVPTVESLASELAQLRIEVDNLKDNVYDPWETGVSLIDAVETLQMEVDGEAEYESVLDDDPDDPIDMEEM